MIAPFSHEPARRPRSLHALIRAATLALSAGVVSVSSASLPAGAPAPAITLNDLDGHTFNTASLAPRPIILVFGELDHPGVRRACADILEALDDPRLEASSALPILIVARDAPPEQLKKEAQGADAGGGAREGRRWPATILSDPKREAFGAYRVLVQPTVVIVDAGSKVVRSFSGPAWGGESKETLVELLELMLRGATEDQLERVAAGDHGAAPVAPEVARADRLVHLGAQLVRHGLYEVAEARFAEATAASPGHLGAMLGLADLQLRQHRGDEAEALYRSILTKHPDAIEAELGLVAVAVARGEERPAGAAGAAELAGAEAAATQLIARRPDLAKAHYLLGVIHERRGNHAQAAAEYRKAAELLLDR